MIRNDALPNKFTRKFINLKFKDYYNQHDKFMRLIDENKVLDIINE
tara:strand:+ start:76 stop:213 length:138 start_codon:yes stop_codon:yes gene_type:complete